jgi:hypothetical protein
MNIDQAVDWKGYLTNWSKPIFTFMRIFNQLNTKPEQSWVVQHCTTENDNTMPEYFTAL